MTDSKETALARQIRRLVQVATGEIPHLYRGGCPDVTDDTNVRDCECPACRVIIDAEANADVVLD